jgi:hypothetical protein
VRKYALGIVIAALVAVTAHAAIYGGARRFVGGGSNPVQFLGDNLIALWDAEQRFTVADSGGNVGGWTDIKAGYLLTPVSSGQALYQPTAVNGRPGIFCDGGNNALVTTNAALMAALPAGSTAGELWAVVSQTAPAADGATRTIMAYGGASAITARGLQRTVVTVNRGRLFVGDGGTDTINGTQINLSSSHVIRGVFGSTASGLYVDGTNEGSVTSTPTTSTTRFRACGSSNNTAGNLWQGALNLIAATSLLSDDLASQFTTYLQQRTAR